MKIDKSLYDDYATLTLKGEFDTFYCPALMDEVEDLLDRGVNHLMIKAHKRCRAEDGELVVAQPSPFVRDVMTKVGIDKLIVLHDNEATATKAIIKHLNKKELTAEAAVDQEKVLVTFPDETRNQMLGGKKKMVLVGKIANVDGNKMQFLWNGTKAGFNADQGPVLRWWRDPHEVPGQDDQEELLRDHRHRRRRRTRRRRRHRPSNRQILKDHRRRPRSPRPIRKRHGVFEDTTAGQVAPRSSRRGTNAPTHRPAK